MFLTCAAPQMFYHETILIFCSWLGLAVDSWICILKSFVVVFLVSYMFWTKSVMLTCVLSWCFYFSASCARHFFTFWVWKFSIGFPIFVISFFVFFVYGANMRFMFEIVHCLKAWRKTSSRFVFTLKPTYQNKQSINWTTYRIIYWELCAAPGLFFNNPIEGGGWGVTHGRSHSSDTFFDCQRFAPWSSLLLSMPRFLC